MSISDIFSCLAFSLSVVSILIQCWHRRTKIQCCEARFYVDINDAKNYAYFSVSNNTELPISIYKVAISDMSSKKPLASNYVTSNCFISGFDIGDVYVPTGSRKYFSPDSTKKYKVRLYASRGAKRRLSFDVSFQRFETVDNLPLFLR